MFVHYREKFFHVFLSKKQYFYFTAFIHSIRFSKIEQHNFSEKNIPDLWIAVQSIWNFREISQVFCTVIHRHNDERKTAARWQKLRKSGIMDVQRHIAVGANRNVPPDIPDPVIKTALAFASAFANSFMSLSFSNIILKNSGVLK